MLFRKRVREGLLAGGVGGGEQWHLSRSLREVRWGPRGIRGKCILGGGTANEKLRGCRRWACSVSQPEGPGAGVHRGSLGEETWGERMGPEKETRGDVEAG